MITNKEKQFVSFVIYLYNNENTIKKFFLEVLNVCNSNFENYEIIFVNDSSDDLTIQRVHEIINKFTNNQSDKKKPIITIINTSNHHGIEMSMNAGTDLAVGDIIFEFDCFNDTIDGSLIIEAYQKAMSGFDIVSVVPKKIYGLSLLFYKFLNYGIRKQTNLIISEYFRVISRRALNRIKAIVNYISYRKVLYSQCGLPTAKIFCLSPLPHTRQKNFSHKVNLAIESFILFTDNIQKFSLSLCFLFGIFAVIVGIYITIVYFGVKKPVAGWTPIMGFLSIGFFGIFLLFTIVFKYLAVILNTVFVKQRYIISSIEKF